MCKIKKRSQEERSIIATTITDEMCPRLTIEPQYIVSTKGIYACIRAQRHTTLHSQGVTFVN